MAFGARSILSGWSAQDKSAGTSIVTAQSNVTVTVGTLVIVAVAADNLGTTDGDNNEVTSVTDSVGNVYDKLREFTNSQAAAAGGATVALFASVLTTQITATSGHTLTANFSSSRTASAIIASTGTVGASAVQVASGADFPFDAAAPTGVTLSGLSSKEYLWAVAAAIEGPSPQGGSYTSYNNFGIGTTGGGSATNQFIKLYERVLTATGETPTASGFNALDAAFIFVAIEEVVTTPSGAKAGTYVIRQAVNRAANF